MSEYIKRSDVLEAFSNLQPSGFEHSLAGIVAINTVKAVPAADVMPVVYGHWMPIYPSTASRARGYTDLYKCSSCENVVYLGTMTRECDYDGCPYCFAKMDDEVSE